MERDFMGLNSKDSAPVVVKEEVMDGGSKDSGYGRSSGVPWSMSNKVSALPQLMPLKSEQDEKTAKMKSEFQNGDSAHLCNNDKKHLFLASNFFLENPFPATCQNFVTTAMKQQLLGGNPNLLSNVSANNEQWINSKDSGVPAQLTIFYGGTVNVFEDISPEKAQAIMFLAGGYLASTMAQSKLQFQSPPSNMQSPLSVSSCPIDRSNSVANRNDDEKLSMKIGISNTVANKIEQPRTVPSLGSVAATAMLSSAVPQSRRASLARFLEKRKERAMNAAPYKLVKEADCGNPESNGFGFSATSGDGSSFASIVKGN